MLNLNELMFIQFIHTLCLALKEKLGGKNQETPVMTRLLNLALLLTRK